MDVARRRFARFAWAVLAYNIPVILWGAYVRASFSGDGCGAHWPFCNGQVIPRNMGAPMAIEFTHRMMTSIDSIAVIAMCVWAFRAFPRRHAVRLFSILSLVFLFIEALLGAGLVLLRYVAQNQSAGRAWYLSAHLTNTMLLLAALTITAWAAFKQYGSSTASECIKTADWRTRGCGGCKHHGRNSSAGRHAFPGIIDCCRRATGFFERIESAAAIETRASCHSGARGGVSGVGCSASVEAERRGPVQRRGRQSTGFGAVSVGGRSSKYHAACTGVDAAFSPVRSGRAVDRRAVTGTRDIDNPNAQ